MQEVHRIPIKPINTGNTTTPKRHVVADNTNVILPHKLNLKQLVARPAVPGVQKTITIKSLIPTPSTKPASSVSVQTKQIPHKPTASKLIVPVRQKENTLLKQNHKTAPASRKPETTLVKNHLAPKPVPATTLSRSVATLKKAPSHVVSAIHGNNLLKPKTVVAKPVIKVAMQTKSSTTVLKKAPVRHPQSTLKKYPIVKQITSAPITDTKLPVLLEQRNQNIPQSTPQVLEQKLQDVHSNEVTPLQGTDMTDSQPTLSVSPDEQCPDVVAPNNTLEDCNEETVLSTDIQEDVKVPQVSTQADASITKNQQLVPEPQKSDTCEDSSEVPEDKAAQAQQQVTHTEDTLEKKVELVATLEREVAPADEKSTTSNFTREQKKQFNKLVQHAKKLEKNGDLQTALEYYQAALKFSPNPAKIIKKIEALNLKHPVNSDTTIESTFI